MDGSAKINIPKEKLYGPSFSEASRRYQLEFTRFNYFLALLHHIEMLIRMNINFLNLSNNWLKEQDPVKQP